MQRLSLSSFVLGKIVFPRLAELRSPATAAALSPATGSSSSSRFMPIATRASFCSSYSINRPSTDAENVGPSQPPIPMWSASSSSGYGSPRPRGHDPPPRLLIPSSSAQRAKIYLGMDMHQDASGALPKVRSKQPETAALALRRILDVYQVSSTSTSTIKHEQSHGQPSSPSSTISPGSQSTIQSSMKTTATSTPTTLSYLDRQTHITTPLKVDVGIPPILTRLLSARLYRLAVFHTLSTPEYASDRVLVFRLIEELEKGGAGKLARRLKRSWEVVHLPNTNVILNGEQSQEVESRSGSGSNQKDKMRLWSEPRDNGNGNGGRLPPNHWQPICVPPTSSISSSAKQPQSNTERTLALTAHYNAHLIYLLTRPSSPSTHSRYPAIPISPTGRKPWPSPNSSLAQLRKLIMTIEKLEKSRGFKSDWKTAEIVIGCWLRCLSSREERYGHGYGVNRSREVGFGSVEIMALFEIVRRAMERSPSLAGLQHSHQDTTNLDKSARLPKSKSKDVDQSLTSGFGDEKEWIEHIRHFGKLVLRALRDSGSGDQRNIKRVVKWMRDQKGANAKLQRSQQIKGGSAACGNHQE